MLSTRNNRSILQTIVLAIVLAGMFASPAVLAECQPGQMQEANLAFQSAQEFLVNRQWDQAIARLQSIVQVCPEHVDATRGIGTAMMGKGMFAESVPYFQQVIELRGDYVQAGDYANLGKAFAKQKMYTEARGEYMKAQQLAPDDCGVLYNLGAMHNAAKFYSQSVEVLEHALDACPEISEPVLKLLTKSAEKAAAQQKANGNNDRAQYFTGLAQKYGGQAGGSTTYDMVKQKMKQKDYQGAVTLLDQMLAKDPNHTGGLLTLARAQDQLKNRSASIDAYKKYLAIKSNDENATAAMLQVMVENGQCSLAKTEAASAARAFEGKGREALAPIMYSWGLALECTGEYDAARDKFQQCAASGHARYAPYGARQVERMEGLKAVEEAEKKKAAQGR
ncbi:MAG: tetratricopeptide repeat protein [Candidatus Krumholzibacteriota bacterium]